MSNSKHNNNKSGSSSSSSKKHNLKKQQSSSDLDPDRSYSDSSIEEDFDNLDAEERRRRIIKNRSRQVGEESIN